MNQQAKNDIQTQLRQEVTNLTLDSKEILDIFQVQNIP